MSFLPDDVSVIISSYCNTVEWFWWDRSLSRWPTGFLQCFDAVGWVIWLVKIVPEMTYKVSSGTLNLCSINRHVEVVGFDRCRPIQLGFQWNVMKPIHVSNLYIAVKWSTLKIKKVTWFSLDISPLSEGISRSCMARTDYGLWPMIQWLDLITFGTLSWLIVHC